MKKVSWCLVKETVDNYTKMCEYSSKGNEEEKNKYLHLVANNMKEILGIRLDKKNKEFTKKEKQSCDALSLLLCVVYMFSYNKSEIIYEFKKIGYKVIDDEQDLHNCC